MIGGKHAGRFGEIDAMAVHEQLGRVFVQLADTLVNDFDIPDFLFNLTARAVELLDIDAAGLLLADPNGRLRVMATSSDRAERMEMFELQHLQGPCLESFTSGEPIVNVDLAANAERWPRFCETARAAGFTVAHSLPLRLRDEVIGIMSLYGVEPDSYLTQADVDLAQALADVATIGLLQERSLREQSTRNRQLQLALESRTVIEQAKGLLAGITGIPLWEAFATIRFYARAHNRKISAVAQEVVNGGLDIRTLRQR